MRVLDHVVADVERIDGVRQHLHLKAVDEARGLEGLIPPARAFHERSADRLGRGVVHVVDDGLDGLAARGTRVFLLQAVTRRKALHELPVQRLRVILVRDAVERGAGIGGAHHVARLGQRDEADAFADGDRFRVRRHVTDIATRVAAGERQRDLDLGVPRKGLGLRHVDRTASAIHGVRALLRAAQVADGIVCITHGELGGVHEHASAVLCLHGESEQRAAREALLDAARLVRIFRHATEIHVLLDQQHAWSAAREGDEPLASQLVAIEPDVVRAHAPRQRRVENELLLHGRDLEKDLATAFVPVEREEAILLHQSRSARGDGRQAGCGCGCGCGRG